MSLAIERNRTRAKTIEQWNSIERLVSALLIFVKAR